MKNWMRFTRIWMVIWCAAAGQVSAQNTVPNATNLWVIKISERTCRSSPALAPDGTIYQATFDGVLLALSPQGTIRWKFAAGGGTEIKSSPAIADDGTIYFGSRDRRFYAVTPEGKLKWTFATGGWVDSSPAIAQEGTIYFGGWDKFFYALNPTGNQKWKYAVGAIVMSSPAVGADGTIYFGALDKKLYALTPDGKLRWAFSASGEITSSPAIGSDGKVYFASTDGWLYAIKPDGTQQWRFHTGGYTEGSPILDEREDVIVPGPTGEYAVLPDGTSHTLTGLACPVDAAALAVTGEIFCSRPWRTLQAFHINGDFLWQGNTMENVSASPVLSREGPIYATCGRFLYAFEPPGGARPLAKSTWPMFRGNSRRTGRVGK